MPPCRSALPAAHFTRSCMAPILFRTALVPTGVLEVFDEGENLTITLRDDGSAWHLLARRQPFERRLYVQDIRRQNSQWVHRSGIGRLLMNTAIQYLQTLGEEDVDRITGFLFADPRDPLPDQQHRVAFVRRFGIEPNERFDFSTPIRELRLDTDTGIGGAGYPIFVPWAHFQRVNGS